jgi:hypothetical protein
MRHPLASVLALATFAATPAAADSFFDVFFDVTLEVTIDGNPLTLGMMGPASIRVGDAPSPGDPIPLELVSLSLTGNADMSLSGTSLGQVTPLTGGAYDSFFDVFFELDVPAVGVFHNLDALHLVAPLLPAFPFAVDSYFDVNTEIDFVDGGGQGRGSVSGGRFTVPEPPASAALAGGLVALAVALGARKQS